MVSDIQRLEKTMGLRFRDSSLLEEALVHCSFHNEHPDFRAPCNRRLEFVGDAALDLIVAQYLCRRCPDADPGALHALRAALVNTNTLARFARRIRLGDYLYLSRGEDQSGGRQKDGLLADTFEALVGAIYLDQGLAAAREFVTRFVEWETASILKHGLDKDFKGRLQEWALARFHVTPVYRTVAEYGPNHAKVFAVEVLVGEEVCGRGEGRNKQAAQQDAARDALRSIDGGATWLRRRSREATADDQRAGPS